MPLVGVDLEFILPFRPSKAFRYPDGQVEAINPQILLLSIEGHQNLPNALAILRNFNAQSKPIIPIATFIS